eukprot:TRINITY_DN25050_c0_g1_i1.p1 TRINITY_DN25050_c0_g1~~TRINITY_DN25050_c0_g1_i1.p1  ORF type:complete len:266 (+),score=30.50 TRINITY_DN25050_c0_g1_i1:32-829(+)
MEGETYVIEPLAVVESPFKQKFAIPRQPRLCPEAKAKVVFLPKFSRQEFVRGLEDFSHVWVLFRFHETADKGYSAMVRPPKLDGEKKGVFATRSTYRPNGIGMSCVKLDSIQYKNGKLWLEISGGDLLDGTPVVDIKPYIPYSDSLPEATSGFADSRPTVPTIDVDFADQPAEFCAAHAPQYPNLREFITSILKQDPRPNYRREKESKESDAHEYGTVLYDLNVHWVIEGDRHTVTLIKKQEVDKRGKRAVNESLQEGEGAKAEE